MTRKTFASVAALASAVAVVPATSALAQSDAPTTVESLEVVSAFAYVERDLPGPKDYVRVVVKTADELPRRFDGMIRAGGALDGVQHSMGSVRTAAGKATRCYAFLAEIKDGKVRGTAKKASIGSKHTVKVSARGTSGDLHDTISVTLRKERKGDGSGKALGC
ncbi:hypothetical protein [Conexibacter sp. SYSU D00693]|uniref:hypothetical protein n=1 Tax=Conexibacter sp. SYSU D00693 TaxID=2812560 RepID=UPI00196B3FB0|nr:hypothetical protein [Conexibacter sp. SYSU D00693]